MSIILQDTTVTIDGTPAAMTLADLPHPVVLADGIEIAWDRPSTIDHAGPTTLTFQMLRPAVSRMPLPALDAEVIVRTRPVLFGSADQPVTVFRGWIDSVVDHPREGAGPVPDLTGYTLHTVTAIDPIGLLQRTKIGQPPWPAESGNTRIQRIRDLVPQAFGTGLPQPGGIAAALDVDARPAWELVAGACPPSTGILHLDSEGLLSWSQSALDPTSHARLHTGTTPMTVSGAGIGAFGLDARLVPEVERSDAWDTGLSTITISAFYGAQDGSVTERSHTIGRRLDAGQTMQITTHSQHPTPAADQDALRTIPLPAHMDATLLDLAQAILDATTTPPRALPTITLPFSETSYTSLITQLLETGPDRTRTFIALLWGPLGVPTAWVILGGRFRLAHDPADLALELTLAPVQSIGITPISFADLQYPGTRWDAGTTVQFDQTGVLSSVEP